MTQEENKTNGIVANDPQAGTPVSPANDVPPEAVFDPNLNGEREDSEEAIDYSLLNAGNAYRDAASEIITRPLNTRTVTRASTYEDMFRQMHPDPTPTLDEMMMEASRDRRNRTIAAIGDFATAIANMGGTMAGAPSQTLPQGGAKKAYDDRVEQLRKLRKERSEQWEKGLERSMVRDDKIYNAQLTENQRLRQLEQADRKQFSDMYLRIADSVTKAHEARLRGDYDVARMYTEQARLETERAKAKVESVKAEKTGALMDAQTEKTIKQGNAAIISANKKGTGGSRGGKKTTYIVDGVEYPTIEDAWANMPDEYKGLGDTEVSMKKDVAEYNAAQAKKKGGAQANQGKKKTFKL